MENLILDIKNLQRKIDGVTVIKAITAQVKAGDVVALLGKNGAGKTTLLETLLGFAFPSFGSVTIWDVPATAVDGDIKQRIGFVPQQDELLPGFTGAEHLSLFKSFRTTWNDELVDRLVAEWLIPIDVVVRKLSVGQRQKLSILLAIAHEPDLLILDEPAASLDPVARRQFIQYLVEMAASSERAIILSSHIVSDLERVANQVWMLQKGELSYQGALDDLKESVARITINSEHDLPSDLRIPNTIAQRVKGRRAVVTLKGWHSQYLDEFAKQFNANIQVEHLSLEDIFLEMNE